MGHSSKKETNYTKILTIWMNYVLEINLYCLYMDKTVFLKKYV